MDGLDAIRDRISYIAGEKASDLDYAAEKKIKGIIDDARKEADGIISRSYEACEKEKQTILKRANSLAVAEKRKILLSKKQDIIDDILNKALEYMKNYPEDKKRLLYKDMIEKNVSGKGDEILIFNKADRSIALEIIDNLKKDAVISEERGDFSGGFIVVRGNIETNLTFDMMVKHYRSDLISIAANSLFGEGNS